VTGDPGQAAGFRPTAVAIHDDRDMTGLTTSPGFGTLGLGVLGNGGPLRGHGVVHG
jgi:hypothetical protein